MSNVSKESYIIELNDIAKKFSDSETYVVENFNLKIKKGEFVTFLGPSGCGKTTTLRMIAGFETPTSGEILLNGEDISLLPPYKRPINTVFQKYALFAHLNIFENIAFGLKLKKIPYICKDKNGNEVTKYRKYTKFEIKEKVERALKIVDLEGFEHRDIATLSGGQQQRIAIARAIVNEPEILLLDEPLGALDLKMRKEMQLELKEMHRKLGITFIYVTHDQEEALTMSDRIVVMSDGYIQQIGAPKEIYDEPANAFVADFIGESNIYSGTIFPNSKVKILGKLFDIVDKFPINEKVDVVLRPEDIIIGEKGTGIVDGLISSKVFKGIHYQYVVMVGKNEVIVQSTESFEVNSIVSLSVTPTNIHVMKKEFTTNIYSDAYINKNNQVVIADVAWDCNICQLLKDSHLDEEGYLIGSDNKKYDLNDADVIATIGMSDIIISDNPEEGNVQGVIIQSLYLGDHYQYIVRTENDEDFIVEHEWLWNENDIVSIKIAPEKIKLRLKGEIKQYEI